MRKLQIEQVMQMKKISQAELARDMDVERQTIRYYIKQGEKLPVCKVRDIAEKLGVTIFDLLSEEITESPKVFIHYQGETKELTEKDLIEIFKTK